MCGEGFFGVRIKLAGPGVAFDRVVELLRVEGLKPRAKPRGSRGASFSTAFSMSSAVVMVESIALKRRTEKGAEHGACEERESEDRLSSWRNPSRDELLSMGFASLNPSYALKAAKAGAVRADSEYAVADIIRGFNVDRINERS